MPTTYKLHCCVVGHHFQAGRAWPDPGLRPQCTAFPGQHGALCGRQLCLLQALPCCQPALKNMCPGRHHHGVTEQVMHCPPWDHATLLPCAADPLCYTVAHSRYKPQRPMTHHAGHCIVDSNPAPFPFYVLFICSCPWARVSQSCWACCWPGTHSCQAAPVGQGGSST
jgi:hypothetical protein